MVKRSLLHQGDGATWQHSTDNKDLKREDSSEWKRERQEEESRLGDKLVYNVVVGEEGSGIERERERDRDMNSNL